MTAPVALRAALERLAAPAPHLRWRLAVPGEPLAPSELACRTLADDPDALAAAVAGSAAGRGSDDPQVLASLWWQAYAYRVAGTALACWLVSGVAPDVRADAMAIGVARSRPSSVVFRVQDPATGFVERLFAGHLDRVAASLTARHRLGRGLLWGNVAAACASAAGSVREAVGPPWRSRLHDFLAAAPHGLATFGSWSVTADTADPSGSTATDPPDPATDAAPTYRRTTCCLWWKTSVAAGALCADCSLTRSPHETTPA
jgi:ferric iron reductase protein FhuF